jgi:hypothetical protein
MDEHLMTFTSQKNYLNSEYFMKDFILQLININQVMIFHIYSILKS